MTSWLAVVIIAAFTGAVLGWVTYDPPSHPRCERLLLLEQRELRELRHLLHPSRYPPAARTDS